MCQRCQLRINPQTFVFWSRLHGHEGLTPSQWFKSIGFEYYTQPVQSSREWSKFIDAHKLTYKGVSFPVFCEMKCGKCSECCSEKIVNLQQRSLMEASQCKHLFFATFTYDDEHIPYFTDLSIEDAAAVQTLNQKDIQTMVHRISKRLSQLEPDDELYNLDYSMVYVGEYGGQYQRPHYHCLYYVKPQLSPKSMLRLREIFMQDWICPFRVECSRGLKKWIEWLPIPPKQYTAEKKYIWYQRKYQKIKDSYSSDPKVKCVFARNPFFKGFIEDWQIARSAKKTAQYVMKYIGKSFTQDTEKEYDTPFTIRKRGYQKFARAPFIQTPRKRALGNRVLDNADVRLSIENSTDGTFTYRDIEGSVYRSKIITTLRDELYRPFYRIFPNHQLIAATARVALTEIVRQSDQWQHCVELNPLATNEKIKHFYKDKDTDVSFYDVISVAPDMLSWLQNEQYLQNYNPTKLSTYSDGTPKLCIPNWQKIPLRRRRWSHCDNNTMYHVSELFGSSDMDTIRYLFSKYSDLAYRYVATYFRYIAGLPDDKHYRKYIYDRYDFFASKEERKMTQSQIAERKYNQHTYQMNTCSKMSNNI